MTTKVYIQNTINSLLRFKNGLFRPSKKRNLKLLQQRNETLESFTIHEATQADVSKLAALHVKKWNETYGGRGTTVAIREQQWREKFSQPTSDWFILLVENKIGNLVGFAHGKSYDHGDLPSYAGELNKIYLLHDYQRIGLGKKLLREVARKFISIGLGNMVLFGIPQNPSCYFHEAMGGKRLNTMDGVFQGGYGWSDLKKLV